MNRDRIPGGAFLVARTIFRRLALAWLRLRLRLAERAIDRPFDLEASRRIDCLNWRLERFGE